MSGATAKREPSQDGLVLIEKYDTVFRYLYPQVQNFPRVHGKFRDAMLDTMLKIPSEIYLAVKLNQPSKLNTLDSSLAELRWFLRFSSSENVRLITKNQQMTAESLIAEVGGIVNAWKKKFK